MTPLWTSLKLHSPNVSLPLGTISTPQLQSTSTQISFDPLALLAVLHNPRAAGSAARLYTQQNYTIFTWPHTMMVGGALPPFKLLINHLVSQRQSLHPAIEMSKADTAKLEVRSTISDGGYSELPITHSNLWLSDLLSFKPSGYPLNDIQIVYIDNIYGDPLPKGAMPSGGNTGQVAGSRVLRALLISITLANMLMLVAGCIVSVLLADLWSTALFGTCTFHALASIGVAHTRMVRSINAKDRDIYGRQVREDATMRYAVYQRPTGGKIIFKGRQDTLETWARMAWTFHRTNINNTVHWSWMITGFLSAAASVICMVNMGGYLQLAYLGVLLSSSGLEILVTIIARNIQHRAIHYGDTWLITDNEKWSKSVIRAALEVEDRWSLEDLPWIEFGRFPDTKLWANLCDILPELRSLGHTMARTTIVERLSRDTPDGLTGLIDRLTEEICEAQLSRQLSLRKANTHVSVTIEPPESNSLIPKS